MVKRGEWETWSKQRCNEFCWKIHNLPYTTLSSALSLVSTLWNYASHNQIVDLLANCSDRSKELSYFASKSTEQRTLSSFQTISLYQLWKCIVMKALLSRTCLMPWKAQSQKSSRAQRNDAWNTESNILGTQLLTRKLSGNSGSVNTNNNNYWV